VLDFCSLVAFCARFLLARFLLGSLDFSEHTRSFMQIRIYKHEGCQKVVSSTLVGCTVFWIFIRVYFWRMAIYFTVKKSTNCWQDYCSTIASCMLYV
jgi:hypothetical protein